MVGVNVTFSKLSVNPLIWVAYALKIIILLDVFINSIHSCLNRVLKYMFVLNTYYLNKQLFENLIRL